MRFSVDLLRFFQPSNHIFCLIIILWNLSIFWKGLCISMSLFSVLVSKWYELKSNLDRKAELCEKHYCERETNQLERECEHIGRGQ